MNDIWNSFLNKIGANIENETVSHFGEPEKETNAAINNNIVADLSHIALIKVSGDDAATFLHNQLTNDLKALQVNQSHLSGYCSPKGRLLALFRITALEEGYMLALPREILEPTLKRLRMFVLMSKVELADISDSVAHLGVSGPDAEALLQEHCENIPSSLNTATTTGAFTIIRIPGPHSRYEIFGDAEAATQLWEKLANTAQAAGAEAWELLDICSGQPVVHKETVESFVPQMVNLQAVEGLSFTKGCYPGQEVVARMQYLGKLKRRMYLGHLQTDDRPQAGDLLFTQRDGDERKTGEIVAAQRSPEGGIDLLAVIEIESADNRNVHLGSTSGPELQLKELPYPLEA